MKYELILVTKLLIIAHLRKEEHNMRTNIFKFVFFSCVIMLFSNCSKEIKWHYFPKLDLITEGQIKNDLIYLASEEMQGREAGLAGAKLAADFLKGELNKLDLDTLINDDGNNLNDFSQNFRILGTDLENVQSALTIDRDGEEIKAKYWEDYFYFFNSPQQVDVMGEIVFAGFAIFSPEYYYNDFKDLDLQDKIVVAYYGEPLQNDTLLFFNGKHQTKYMMSDWKAQEVAKRGGKALILIPNPENEDSYERFLKRRIQSSRKTPFVLDTEKSVPVLYLSNSFTKRIFSNFINKNFSSETEKLRIWLEKNNRDFFSWKGTNLDKLTWSVRISYDDPEVRNCQNLVALYSGNHPQLKDEFILIGSHYDHEGMRNGEVFLGADDNASGVSANLNIARAFAELTDKEKPARSVIFAFWDAEEKGTLGTKYFTDHSPFPLDRIKVVFNMDMIGRDASFNFAALRKPMIDENAENKVMIFYSAQSPELKELAKKSNFSINLHLLYDPNVFFTSGSDHVVFHSRHIPIVFYFTGFHTDYTSLNDTPEKINFTKLTKITRHIANFVYHLSMTEQSPGFNKKILSAPEGDFRM